MRVRARVNALLGAAVSVAVAVAVVVTSGTEARLVAPPALNQMTHRRTRESILGRARALSGVTSAAATCMALV